MAKGNVLNYTTQINAEKSAGEIVQLLAVHRARRIELLYSEGKCVGLSFSLLMGDQEQGFRLPVNSSATFQRMHSQWKEGRLPARYASKEQAERVSWRILKDWVEAQIAIIETGMVTPSQVFLPYLLVDGQRTLYEVTEERMLLTASSQNE